MRSIILPFILLTALAASLYFLVQAEGGVSEVPRLLERAGVPVPGFLRDIENGQTAPSPPADPDSFTSGNSRFSQGRCTADSECAPAGCSGEVCSNNPGEVVTTCEFSRSFPNARGFTCQCLPQGVCGWAN